MKDYKKEKIFNEHETQRKIKSKTMINNRYNSFKSFSMSNKKEIQSYLFKKEIAEKINEQNSWIKNYKSDDYNKIDDSIKINTFRLTNSSGYVKSIIQDSARTLESFDGNSQLKKITRGYSSYYNNDNKKNFLLSQKGSSLFDMVLVNENKSQYGRRQYLLTKFKLIDEGSSPNKDTIKKTTYERKGKSGKYKYFSLAKQRYNDLLKFRAIRKKLFSNYSAKGKTDNEFIKAKELNYKTQQNFIKNKNGVFLLKKINQGLYRDDRNLAKKKMQTIKNEKLNHSNNNIFGNFGKFKLKINEDNNKMKRVIKNEFSKLKQLRKTFVSNRPNENTKKGLEELFYSYNKQRAKNEKIVTNRLIDDNHIYSPLEELFPDRTRQKKNNINILNSHNIINIAQNKVNKLFHDLLIFQLPKLSDAKYVRKVLYDIFIEFKLLLFLSMLKNKDIEIDKKGIDFNTFYNCNTKMNQQGIKIAKKIFEIFNNKTDSKYMNFHNYIEGMLKIKDTNKENKLNLFFEMLDNNSDGCLAYDDIYKLSIICLSKITLNIEDEEDYTKIVEGSNKSSIDIVKGLAEYFCKMIFKLVDVDTREKIPLDLLKRTIIKGGEQADYIELLFGSAGFT